MRHLPRPIALAATVLLTAGGTDVLGPPLAASPAARSAGPLPPPFLAAPTPWADSVLATLSLEERIAQLMMVAAYSDKDAKHEAAIEKLVRERHIGGLIFFQGGPGRQARLTDRYQAAARTPLLLGMDLEWGLAMRLDSTVQFPRQMALGAVQDDRLIEAMGTEIARQMRRLGVHVSFSPVADVNNNPRNPVINDRSFGEDRANVARKAIAYMRGLQAGGVLAVAKHFPGHGDTDTDSHHTLPVVPHPMARLDSLELWPFRRMVGEGLAGMMVAHLEVPALDSTRGLPSTLSAPIVNDLLLGEMGFDGLVFTDALNMKGVANAEKPGEIELRALLAGNDVMLFPQDPAKAIDRIRRAVADGELDSARIDHSCLKVLRAKEWAGLHRGAPPIDPQGLHADLNTPAAEALRRRLYAAAITVAADHHGVLPFHDLDTLRIASVVIGDPLDNAFQRSLKQYADVAVFRCDKAAPPDSLKALLAALGPYHRVIVSVHGTTWRVGRRYGIPAGAQDIVRAIAANKPTVNVYFANPYRLADAHGAQLKATTVIAYEENDAVQDLVAQALFGAIPVNGRLPVSPNAFHKAGDGIAYAAMGRLGRAVPEEIGLSTGLLAPIDSIVRAGITAQAYPGAQVLVAVDGRVVVDRAYGHHSYDRKRPVRTDDLYDLASITKVAATTLALMKLVDEGRIDIDKRLGHYLPELEKDHGAHARMALRDILTHQAGLRAFEPFHLRLTGPDGRFKPGVVSDTSVEPFTVRLAEGLYMHKAYTDSLLPWVLGTKLARSTDYLYSDMGYYLLQEVIERITGRPLDRYVEEVFHRPMGATTRGYRPLARFPGVRFAPTE
ncbi:MAG: glycoside hydrolase family 3 N-terminal domain-containing protein, partial [Flavobacteriales bacterium]|nr:glycoside hydrolase family 3 N-terminal domain-containing protein [Flavobacteriales bacterium]